MKDKNSFVLYTDLIHTVNQLPPDKAGLLFQHILRYVNDEDPETDELKGFTVTEYQNNVAQ